MTRHRGKAELIVALDTPGLPQALELVERLDIVTTFKVGNQLFTTVGPEAVRALREREKEVFLDLKFHDIPNTVAGAARAATEMGVMIFNVHCLGGTDMMRAAAESASKAAGEHGVRKPIVLGVTLLTSMDESLFRGELGFGIGLDDAVVALAGRAREAGLDGVVASAREIAIVREACGPDFTLLTPGIRPSPATAGTSDDQRRTATPREAVRSGANYLVVGRPITEAADPREAARRILEDMEVGQQERSTDMP